MNIAEKPLTGRHVFAIFLIAFGTIVCVNIFMAYSAVKTFPGVEVENSYIASQTFDQRKFDQIDLGWVTHASYENGQLEFSIRDRDGNALRAGAVDAVIGRPTTDRNDERVDFVIQQDVYAASIPLDAGMWMLKINAVSHQGDPFTQRFDIWVN